MADRLISEAEAIDAICMEWCNVKHQDCKHPFDDEKDDCYWCDGCETVLRTLPDLPTAQPERAIKDCRNCKFGDYNEHWNTNFCYYSGDCINWDKWEPTAQPEQQWIPVKEHLPEDRVPILITDSEGDVIKGEYWSDNCWQCFVTAEEFLTIHDPVAWMPLPAPYKEDKE